MSQKLTAEQQIENDRKIKKQNFSFALGFIKALEEHGRLTPTQYEDCENYVQKLFD